MNPRTLMPGLFVVMWCGGYVFGSFATRTIPPFALAFWRFFIAAAVLTLVAVVTHAPWPKTWFAWRNLILVGLSLQAVFYSSNYLGMSMGVPAALSALIGGIAPLAIAVTAVALLGERLTARQWAGSVLGVAG